MTCVPIAWMAFELAFTQPTLYPCWKTNFESIPNLELFYELIFFRVLVFLSRRRWPTHMNLADNTDKGGVLQQINIKHTIINEHSTNIHNSRWPRMRTLYNTGQDKSSPGQLRRWCLTYLQWTCAKVSLNVTYLKIMLFFSVHHLQIVIFSFINHLCLCIFFSSTANPWEDQIFILYYINHLGLCIYNLFLFH